MFKNWKSLSYLALFVGGALFGGGGCGFLSSQNARLLFDILREDLFG
jgi:hypothetical protein